MNSDIHFLKALLRSVIGIGFTVMLITRGFARHVYSKNIGSLIILINFVIGYFVRSLPIAENEPKAIKIERRDEGNVSDFCACLHIIFNSSSAHEKIIWGFLVFLIEPGVAFALQSFKQILRCSVLWTRAKLVSHVERCMTSLGHACNVYALLWNSQRIWMQFVNCSV